MSTVTDIFGSMVFDDRVMRATLSSNVYASLRKTIDEGSELDISVANAVAEANHVQLGPDARGLDLCQEVVDEGNESRSCGSKTDRREFRYFRTYRKRDRSSLPRFDLSYRDGDGKTGVFLRKTKSVDDANRAQNVGLPQR